MQRAQPAETGPRQVEIERWPGQLARNQESDGESGDAPEYRYCRGEFDRTQMIVGPAVDFLGWQRVRTIIIAVEDGENRPKAGGSTQSGMKCEGRIQGLARRDQAKKCCR